LREWIEHLGGSGSRWREAPGPLCTYMLWFDGQVGAVVSAEKHVVDPAVVSDEMAGQLGRLVQQMGLGAEDGEIKQSDRDLGSEPVKLGFTREAGSFRRRGSPVREPGE